MKSKYFFEKIIVIQNIICNFAAKIQNISLKIDEQSGLKQILASNQKDVENYQVVPRELPSDEFERRVFIGVRRAGKSFMLYQKMQQMLAEGLAAVFIYGGRQ